ncbi:Histone-lysine N-methyltransferase pr-set7 [Orchesella cincta]|uniref:[histone H4]-lysine(20) N-methyltransferase n=1 Tax=Orchesella cincta TaxID=48709 RepID=A0A1D2MAJ6_ORCCI|nr:Histone-lysine N-methyltransferase pr-set7 [Orchesella cincta]
MPGNRRPMVVKNYAESSLSSLNDESSSSSSSPLTPPPRSKKKDDKQYSLKEKLTNGSRSSPPHRIQTPDVKSVRLENYLVISSPISNAHARTYQQQQDKTCDGARKQPKLTDYFVQRRSSRKTKEAINTEKHQLLIKQILSGKQDGLKVKLFEGDKGRGVVTTKRFLRHEFVVEYEGELLTVEEACVREKKYAKDASVGCYMYYFQHNSQQYCLDATKESNRLGRLVNHSRNGNLVTKAVEVNGTPRLILIAKRDIDKGEELSYDYGDRSQEALRHHPWLAY